MGGLGLGVLQRLIALAALVEGLGSVLSAHASWLTTSGTLLSFRNPTAYRGL